MIRSATKRVELSAKELEIRDWIQHLIVPALVDKYIAEKVLNPEVDRG